MAVTEKTVTDEQKQAEQAQVDKKVNNFLDNLSKDYDLSTENQEEGKEKASKETARSEEKEVSAEEDTGEVEEETSGEEIAEEEEIKEDEEEEEEKKEDELVPRSKHDKIVKKLQDRISTLTRQSKIQSENKISSDSDMDKLLKMNNDQLRALKKNIKVAMVKEIDEDKLSDLAELEIKVDEVIQTAPQRFLQTQINEYNAKAEEIMLDPVFDGKPETSQKIIQIAQRIYAKQPALQQLKEGQAIALESAWEHYKEILKYSVGKEKFDELQRKNINLKRKTALDAATLKSKGTEADLKRLREKAKTGTLRDKEEFFRSDPLINIDSLIPEEFKEG
jgi:hypothetical protein